MFLKVRMKETAYLQPLHYGKAVAFAFALIQSPYSLRQP